MRIGRLTLTLIVLCVVVFLATGSGDKTSVVEMFTFTPFRLEGNRVFFPTGLGPTLAEPWRLVTPMFLHFGFLHIIFNMWWLKDLGSAIERVFSPLYLLLLVLVIGVGSHFLEWKMSGPTMFGGMSGVVYGLFAFIWVRGRLDPAFPYRIPTQLVTFMLIWLGLGFTGAIGHIANWVHLGGLVGGAAWGFLSSGYLGRSRSR
jgi:GlpG protein